MATLAIRQCCSLEGMLLILKKKITIFREEATLISLSWFSCGSSILVELAFGVWRKTREPGSGNRTRATLVGGERSHHCAITAPHFPKPLVHCIISGFYIHFIFISSYCLYNHDEPFFTTQTISL